MENKRQLVCDRCKKLGLVSDMKYLPKGDFKETVCLECRNKNNPAKEKVVKKEPVKKLYLCTRCKYKSYFDPKGVNNLLCPYCGKGDKLDEYNPQSADKIIKTLHD